MFKGLLSISKVAVEKVREAVLSLDQAQKDAFLASFANFVSVEDGVVCSVKESSLVAEAKVKWVYSYVSHEDQISGQVRTQRLKVDILRFFFEGWEQSEEEGVYKEQDESYVRGILYKTSKERYFVVVRYKKSNQHSFRYHAFAFQDDYEFKEWSSKNLDIKTYIDLFDG